MSTEPSPLRMSTRIRDDFALRRRTQLTPISLTHLDGHCVVQVVVLGRHKDDVELYPCGDVVALGQRFRFSRAYVAMLLEQGIPYVEAIETAAFVARALEEVQTIAELGDRSIIASVEPAEIGGLWCVARLRYARTERDITRPIGETPNHPNAEFARVALFRYVKHHLAMYPDAKVDWLPARTTEGRFTCSASST